MSFGHKFVPCLWSVSSRRSLCSACSFLLFSFVIFLLGRLMLLFLVSICEWHFLFEFALLYISLVSSIFVRPSFLSGSA